MCQEFKCYVLSFLHSGMKSWLQSVYGERCQLSVWLMAYIRVINRWKSAGYQTAQLRGRVYAPPGWTWTRSQSWYIHSYLKQLAGRSGHTAATSGGKHWSWEGSCAGLTVGPELKKYIYIWIFSHFRKKIIALQDRLVCTILFQIIIKLEVVKIF